MKRVVAIAAVGISAVAVAYGGVAYASSQQASPQFYGCIQSSGNLTRTITHVQKSPANCPRGAQNISWSQQGPQGPQGATGLTGATGPAGTTGSQGTPGSAGPTGPAGAVGPTGPAGPQGNQGNQGDPGRPGPSSAGPRGLDVTTVNITGYESAYVYCPSDHPYVIGGGAISNESDYYAPISESAPITSGEQGWEASTSYSTYITAYAICAK